MLQKLVKDCEPATFGKGQEDVLDTEYRKAGMDTNNFATTFHPNTAMIENIEQLLLPSVNTEEQNSLGFRRLDVELYKLNVYSGPSGIFRKHVDTPRSESQIGSLVVCLPSKFKGGKFTVQHAEKSVEFDWASQSDSTIQWAALYSDCEHEIETVSEGERITLTYNLYVTEPPEVHTQPKDIIQPKSLPLYGYLAGVMADSSFMEKGGVLGFYCSHAYPHSSKYASAMLPRGLKGSDLMLYSVLKSLGVDVKVLPILGDTEFEGEDYEGEEEEELEEHEKGEPMQGETSEHFTKGKTVVGKDLYQQTDFDGPMEMRDDYENELKDSWQSYAVKGVTWISEPKHSQRAITYVAYGNESSIGTVYSYAAILAIIPPPSERKGA